MIPCGALKLLYSTSVTWTLFALTQHQAVQKKLREELLGVQTEAPTFEELNSLTYLDQVIRESLRLYAPVTATIRSVGQDDAIPLNEAFTDTKGNVQTSIPLVHHIFFMPRIAHKGAVCNRETQCLFR